MATIFFVLFIFVQLLFEGSYYLRRVYSVGKPVVINDSWITHVQAIQVYRAMELLHYWVDR